MKDFITKNKIINIFAAFFWLSVWEIFSLIVNREIYLPSPIATFKALYSLLLSLDTYIAILYSSYRTTIGFFFSCILGIMLGSVCGVNDVLYNIFRPFINTIRALPIISIIIITLLWFSDTNVPIFVTFLMSFPIIWTNTVTGVHQTDEKLLQMCEIYKIKKSRVIKSVYMNTALPYIKSSMISALGMGWKVTSAAEVLSLPRYAVGSNLYDMKITLQIPELFAWTFIIILLSYFFENILNKMLSGVKTYDFLEQSLQKL